MNPAILSQWHAGASHGEKLPEVTDGLQKTRPGLHDINHTAPSYLSWPRLWKSTAIKSTTYRVHSHLHKASHYRKVYIEVKCSLMLEWAATSNPSTSYHKRTWLKLSKDGIYRGWGWGNEIPEPIFTCFIPEPNHWWQELSSLNSGHLGGHRLGRGQTWDTGRYFPSTALQRHHSKLSGSQSPSYPVTKIKINTQCNIENWF